MQRLLAVLFVLLVSTLRLSAAKPPELSRGSTFVSLDAFIASAKSFRPNKKPTEFAYIFSVPEYDNGSFQGTVFATSVNKVELLWQGAANEEGHAVFALYAEPKTESTPSYVGVIVLLQNEGAGWSIYDVKREATYGLRGGVRCRLADGSNPNTKLESVRVTIESEWAGIHFHGPLQRWTYKSDNSAFTLVNYTITDDE